MDHDRAEGTVRNDIHAPIFGTAVQAGFIGELHVDSGKPDFRVEPFVPANADLPAPHTLALSQLLVSRFEVVGFAARGDELLRLSAWRDASTTQPAVMLIHGPGGQGKSRLAAEFAKATIESGWRVLAARHRIDSPMTAGRTAEAPDGRPAATDRTGLLLVVDYADRWPYSDITTLLQERTAPQSGAGPIRILLLARSAGQWWDALAHHFTSLALLADEMALKPVATSAKDRTGLFIDARNRFAELLDVADPQSVPVPQDLGSNDYAQILTLHMAALTSVDAHARGLAEPAGATALSVHLLRREKGQWQVAHERDPRTRVSAVRMARAVYCATLLGPLSWDDALAVMDAAGLASSAESATELLDEHCVAFPSADQNSVLAPLKPDRLGENFLALQVPGHGVAGYQPDPWATGAPVRLVLALNDDRYTARALTRLIEIVHRWPHVAHSQLYPLLREKPAAATAIGNAGLSRLAAVPDLDMDVLGSVAMELPEGRDVDVDVGAAAVADRLVAWRLADGTLDPEGAAMLHRWHGFRLANAGRYEESAEAAARSVEIYRELTAEDPAHQADLANALTNLAGPLDACGRLDQAVAAAKEAWEIRAGLHAAEPDVHKADLAQACSNVAVLLFRHGDFEEAIAIAEEAMDAYEELIESDPGSHAGALAAVHANLGMMLSEIDSARALRLTARAVDVFTELTAQDLGQFSPDLADSMSNLASNLADSGRTVEALQIADKATLIYRRLVDANPQAYEPGFVRLLSNTAATLYEEGKTEEAFVVAQAAADIHERLTPRGRTGYELVLEKTLTDLTSALIRSDRQDDAATAAMPAAALLSQRLAASAGIADSRTEADLSKLTALRIAAGLLSEAADSYGEACAVHAGLDAGEHRACGLPGLGEQLIDILTRNGLEQPANSVRASLGDLQRHEPPDAAPR